jgi:hypothetical protein
MPFPASHCAPQILDSATQAVACTAAPFTSKIISRGAYAVSRGAAHCASQVLDRGAQADAFGAAQVLDRGAQAAARGSARCALQVPGRYKDPAREFR